MDHPTRRDAIFFKYDGMKKKINKTSIERYFQISNVKQDKKEKGMHATIFPRSNFRSIYIVIYNYSNKLRTKTWTGLT